MLTCYCALGDSQLLALDRMTPSLPVELNYILGSIEGSRFQRSPRCNNVIEGPVNVKDYEVGSVLLV